MHPWLAALRSLQHLQLKDYCKDLWVTPAIGMLTGLESLELQSTQISFSAGTRLPASITQLHLGDDSGTDMPQQASEQAVGVKA